MPPPTADAVASSASGQQIPSRMQSTRAQRQPRPGGAGASPMADPTPSMQAAVAASEHQPTTVPATFAGLVGGRKPGHAGTADELYQCHGRVLPADLPGLAQLVRSRKLECQERCSQSGVAACTHVASADALRKVDDMHVLLTKAPWAHAGLPQELCERRLEQAHHAF